MKFIKYAIVILLCLFVYLFTVKIVHAGILDWLTGWSRTVVVEIERVEPVIKTLESEIDRLSIKYNVASSTARVIIKCESQMYGSAVNYNRLPDGTIWSKDWGPFQINDYYHKKTMENLGLNYYDQFDSLEYGFMLLSSQGVGPWKASVKCHGLR